MSRSTSPLLSSSPLSPLDDTDHRSGAQRDAPPPEALEPGRGADRSRRRTDAARRQRADRKQPTQKSSQGSDQEAGGHAGDRPALWPASIAVENTASYRQRDKTGNIEAKRLAVSPGGHVRRGNATATARDATRPQSSWRRSRTQGRYGRQADAASPAAERDRASATRGPLQSQRVACLSRAGDDLEHRLCKYLGHDADPAIAVWRSGVIAAGGCDALLRSLCRRLATQRATARPAVARVCGPRTDLLGLMAAYRAMRARRQLLGEAGSASSDARSAHKIPQAR